MLTPHSTLPSAVSRLQCARGEQTHYHYDRTVWTFRICVAVFTVSQRPILIVRGNEPNKWIRWALWYDHDFFLPLQMHKWIECDSLLTTWEAGMSKVNDKALQIDWEYHRKVSTLKVLMATPLFLHQIPSIAVRHSRQHDVKRSIKGF